MPERRGGPESAATRGVAQSAIDVRGLWKYFGHFPALRGVDLELAAGRFLTVFGPNGAGKTTLIKVLSTQIGPSEGHVSVGGYPLEKDPGRIRSAIGVISHNTYLYPNLTALENLHFYGTMYALDDVEERARELLEEVGLTGRMHDRVSTYSRGMQQRLSIARALLHRPSIMFLDEPYTGLDQHAARMLRSLLETLHDGRRTLFMVTHNLQEGLETCDEVAIQVGGRIVFHEAMEKVNREHFGDVYFEHVGAGAG